LILLQLLPILVFLVVDATVKEPLWAIGAALLLVLVQTVVIYARERRLDPFILVDALLIGGLGAVSLLSRNELFFKLKPAIMEAVIIPFFLVLALGGERLARGYFGRFLGGASINPRVLPLLRRLLGVMSVLVAVHAGLVVWAAYHASRQTWGWISGPGFYAVLAPILLWALYRRLAGRKLQPEPDPEPEPEPAARPRVSGRRRARRAEGRGEAPPRAGAERPKRSRGGSR
jgi:intracellular septation protein A